ncbi:MAG: hypothetical protein P8184_17025 [Calditrichia bacterium]
MFALELEIFTGQKVRGAGSDTNLANSEPFMMHQDDSDKVPDISLNGCFGMVGLLFNLGELVSGHIHFEYLGFVRGTAKII